MLCIREPARIPPCYPTVTQIKTTSSWVRVSMSNLGEATDSRSQSHRLTARNRIRQVPRPQGPGKRANLIKSIFRLVEQGQGLAQLVSDEAVTATLAISMFRNVHCLLVSQLQICKLNQQARQTSRGTASFQSQRCHRIATSTNLEKMPQADQDHRITDTHKQIPQLG